MQTCFQGELGLSFMLFGDPLFFFQKCLSEMFHALYGHSTGVMSAGKNLTGPVLEIIEGTVFLLRWQLHDGIFWNLARLLCSRSKKMEADALSEVLF